MGHPRPKPARLAEKLRQIRLALGLSQQEMHRRLGVEDLIAYNEISKYELGKNEPYLQILLQYARVAGVHMEDIADDELDLPENLPGNYNHKGIKHTPSSRKKSKR
ncbi:MAG TPA: helix-turn-helix transcriptional regulator [Pyrinomonadaceae bacterium]|nr:helix-turn-helix transcriptional regulator [Pyrinomonadaceae bacterium]